MDMQRFFFIGVTALISYLLLIEWREFNDESLVTREASSAQAPSYINTSDQLKSEIADTLNSANFEDLPEVANEPKSINLDQILNTANTISIKTDVLSLTVDLSGGDITEAKLIKYPTSLENPNQPFELLENNSQRIYKAQSGLMGLNGIDKNGKDGRASFIVSSDTFSLEEEENELKQLAQASRY